MYGYIMLSSIAYPVQYNKGCQHLSVRDTHTGAVDESPPQTNISFELHVAFRAFW